MGRAKQDPPQEVAACKGAQRECKGQQGSGVFAQPAEGVTQAAMFLEPTFMKPQLGPWRQQMREILIGGQA